MDTITSAKALRHIVNMSGRAQEKLAEYMGYSRSYITSTLARGSILKLDTISRVAHACGYRLYLVGHGETIEITDDTPDSTKL